MHRSVFSLAVLPAAALIIAGGCGDDDAATQSSDVSQTTPAATTDVDPVTGLPRSFPDDFPVIDGAVVTRASEYTDRYVIEWRSDEGYEDAKAFYETALDAQPWRIESTSTEESATVIDFAGGSAEQYTGSLAIARLSEGARILLNLHPERPQ